jgi:hypothetical protein
MAAVMVQSNGHCSGNANMEEALILSKTVGSPLLARAWGAVG